MSALPIDSDVPEEFRQAVLDVYPELAAGRFSIAGKGWHSLAIDVDDRLIFKFPDGDEAVQAVRREVSLLRAIRASLSMGVPDMTLHEGPPPFTVHPKLRGETMPAERNATLSEAAKARLGDDLGRFFAQMHGLDRETMRAAGALPVEIWRSDDAVMERTFSVLPAETLDRAIAALRDYRALPPDPLGEVFGFFDAHGWNMAYDVEADRLAGMFDFADAGFGPPHRDFVQPSLIDPGLTLRAIGAYERLTARTIDRRRVFLLTATQRMSELANMIETGGDVPAWRKAVVCWFGQARAFGW